VNERPELLTRINQKEKNMSDQNKLVEVAKEILGNTLPGDYELVDESFVLAQHDQQFFGALTYKSAEFNLLFAVGLRSSYN
jgi:hypothetical protein